MPPKDKVQNSKFEIRNKSKFPNFKAQIGKLIVGFYFVIGIWFLVLSPALAVEGAYPQIDISGFKKWEFKKTSVSPDRNYFTGLTYLGGFYPTFTGGPWQERLQLKIAGQLSEKLSVSYDLEQQPESPDKFDVKVKYENTELTFGDFNASFSGNEFVSTSKYLNGVMLTSKDNWYDAIVVPSSKLKSQTQLLTAQKGNNTRGPYNLGHGGIIEGSEQIQLNGIFLTRNIDYTIDYFEGKVTFNRLLSTVDEFKYSFEYTNVIDLFFPTLSKRDFLGFQSRFTIDPDKWGKPLPQAEPVVTQAREIFPGTVEAAILEGEASGSYQLKNIPVARFSETLTFMGIRLRKDEDYILRYETGELKMLTTTLPSTLEPLSVEYKYRVTSQETEFLQGIGSRGPYRTRHKKVILGSEKILVNEKLFVRDLDYTINYETGELMFSMVLGPTYQIKIDYFYHLMSLPPIAQSKYPKELTVGVVYLKESAKKGAGAPTASVIETFSGQTIITNNSLIKLNYRPLLATSEASLMVRLKQGSTSRELTWEVDYVVPTTEVDPTTGYVNVIPNVSLGYTTDRTDATDGYGAGIIYISNQALNISSTDEISVTYTYKKNVVGKFSGMGNGSRGPYYIRNMREIVPGTETLQVWEQGSAANIITYTRNTSFEANAGDLGYSINYNKDNPYIYFNNDLPATKNFQAIFQYVPTTTNTGGNINQSAIGFDEKFTIGDIFRIDSSFARSETDQVFVAELTTESFSGNGTKNYFLHSTADIIEGSEKIFVNLMLLNRDIDYYVNYSTPGQITFYYVTPTTQDAISVEYKFKTTTGSSVDTKTKADTAFRLGAETKIFGDVLKLKGTTKKIGFDFSPLGGTAISVGSEYQDYNASFNPGSHGFFTNYSYKFNQIPIGTSRKTFLRSYDNTVTAGINPNGAVKIDANYRNYNTLDDPLSTGALHNSDNFQEEYSASVTPSEWKKGALALTQKYNLRKTTSKTDTVDRALLLSTSNIDYYHIGLGLKLTERVTATYDRQYNEPVTLGSLETQTAHSKSSDNAYNISLDLTSGFLQKWIARVALLYHDENKFLPTPEAAANTKNETYHMDFVPFRMLTTSFDHNRQERTSFTLGAGNPQSQKTDGALRLSPLSWLSFGFTGSKGEAIPETGSAFKTTNRSKLYDVNFIPLSLPIINLGTIFRSLDAYQIGPLGSETVKTDTANFSQEYALRLNPIPIIPVTVGYIQEDYKNFNNSLASPVSTETQNITRTVGLNFSPIPAFSLTGNYAKKITKDLLKHVNPAKTNLDGKAIFRPYSWGNFTLDWQSEKNEGEVQGGSVANLNYEKETLTRSLDINIPANSAVISSFVITASWKSVNYKNLNKPDKTDDFYAQLVSLEGTLNF